MPKSRDQLFETLTTEGALLPSDFLQRLSQHDREVPGLTPDAYHLGSGERINEAISRSWNRLLAIWKNFSAAVVELPASDLGTTLTREKWLLPFFQELGYGRLSTAKPYEFEGRRYSISHTWQNTPIHLVSFRADLDTRSENIIGARTTTPHSMVQEFLNRSQGHMWGIVSNGYRLRLLRDNASLTRQAFVEFDLQSMMQGEVYADFALLWLLLHQSRVEGDRPELCWLEKWTQEARQRGARALDQLRDGVQDAISALGSGFLAHPANAALRDKLNAGTLTKQDYFRQLLRIVYRFLFLFVAEDRELLFTDQVPAKTREQYLRHYSLTRLRRMALRLGGTQHADLWHIVRLVFRSLGSDSGCAALGLPALGSFLWSDKATPDLNDAQLANRELLQAIRALAFAEQNNVRRPIDYKNIGTEELGSVYESLLEQHPDVHVPTAKFTLGTHAGHERKTTGSYYTPPSLVQCLLDSALDPVLRERERDYAKFGFKSAEEAILSIKVCDKACGSGHFLIAAAHRIARRLAAVRTGEDEPAPAALRRALRDVIGRCIYGVDINPMAVELCKFALWLEAVEPGKPLSFLDHHIQCGNSLIGATPALMRQGIPDKAFEPIEGDEKEACRKLKKRNQGEREGLGGLFTLHDAENQQALVQAASAMNSLPEESLADVHRKEQAFQQAHSSYDFMKAMDVANLWCAAFVISKSITPGTTQPFGITTRHLMDFAQGGRVPDGVLPESKRLAEQYQFFHWHLAFPDVFQVPSNGTPENTACGWKGGFHVTLGNPPWERIKLQEKEWFAERDPAIADAPNAAARKRLIEALKTTAPSIHAEFKESLRQAEAESHFLRNSNRYPLCGRGDVNTYALFAELAHSLLTANGILGCITPIGLLTETTTSQFFGQLMQSEAVVTSIGFVNERQIFAAVLHNVKFCIFVATGCGRKNVRARFTFNCFGVEDAHDPEKCVHLNWEQICLLNPVTKTCPTFFARKSFEVSLGIYERLPILRAKERSGWEVGFYSMLHMSGDSELFLNVSSDGVVPLYEAKMFHQFDHRAGTFAGGEDGERVHMLPQPSAAQLSNPTFCVSPCYYVRRDVVADRLKGKVPNSYLVALRDVTSVHLGRTCVCAVLPYVGAGHSITLMTIRAPSSIHSAMLVADQNSFAHDFCVRQKLAGFHLSAYIAEQVPCVPLSWYGGRCGWETTAKLSEWLLARVLELTYTAWDLEPFARDCDYGGPPFRWDEERRFLLRCELDAAFFHLYGITRDDAAYIMDTFPIVRRKDEAKWGTYRTKDTILEIYAALAAATQSGQSYQTRLNPPPADPRVAHPPRPAT